MKRQDDFVVGLVVIIAVIVVTGMALWLSRAQLGGRRDIVISRMREVGGAKVGSPVVIRGVEAGHITAFTLDEKDGWVIVKVALDKGMTLPPDPVLLLSEASMFGQWQATLQQRSTAPPNSEVQAQLDDPGARRGGAIPGAVLPGLGDLSVVAGRIAGDVEAVAHRFGTAFSDSAARELRATIKNSTPSPPRPTTPSAAPPGTSTSSRPASTPRSAPSVPPPTRSTARGPHRLIHRERAAQGSRHERTRRVRGPPRHGRPPQEIGGRDRHDIPQPLLHARPHRLGRWPRSIAGREAWASW